jgi:hypothetical protein
LRIIIAALALSLSFIACGGKKDDSADVYVVGEGPMLWKNGTSKRISQHDADAYSVFVQDNDVYASGREYTYTANYAVYWKNGALRRLSSSGRDASGDSIFVSGSNVYVAGFEYNAAWKTIAMLWVNGEATPLTDGEDHAYAHSVYVSDDGVVYVAGVIGYPYGKAMLWVDGEAQQLNDGNNGAAYSVFVTGSGPNKNVYVLGSEDFGSFATLWKNATPQTLTNLIFPQAVFVSDGDVYALGHTLTGLAAGVWKNGVIQSVGDGNSFPRVHSLYVSGGDTYVAGYVENDDGARPTVWKNGKARYLEPKTSDIIAYGVFVVPKPK